VPDLACVVATDPTISAASVCSRPRSSWPVKTGLPLEPTGPPTVKSISRCAITAAAAVSAAAASPRAQPAAAAMPKGGGAFSEPCTCPCVRLRLVRAGRMRRAAAGHRALGTEAERRCRRSRRRRRTTEGAAATVRMVRVGKVVRVATCWLRRRRVGLRWTALGRRLRPGSAARARVDGVGLGALLLLLQRALSCHLLSPRLLLSCLQLDLKCSLLLALIGGGGCFALQREGGEYAVVHLLFPVAPRLPLGLLRLVGLGHGLARARRALKLVGDVLVERVHLLLLAKTEVFLTRAAVGKRSVASAPAIATILHRFVLLLKDALFETRLERRCDVWPCEPLSLTRRPFLRLGYALCLCCAHRRRVGA